MGWRTGSIDGQPLISHDGNTFGFHVNVALLPDIDAAVVVLMARNGVMVKGPETAGLEALIGGMPQVSRAPTIAWIILDAVTTLLVLASILYVMRRRRRLRMDPPQAPRRWPAVLQIAAGFTIGAVVLLAASMSGGIDVVVFRLLLALAPDMTIVASAMALLLVAGGVASLVERRRTALRRAMEPSPMGEGIHA
jgi:hypothetical protein